jgi:ABC-type phosphate/phosphonate transport system substrate-binding protein
MPTLIANARMYAVTPTARAAWCALFEWVSRYSDAPLRYVDHAAPAPLEELWARTDLGAAFMCGFPFATAALRPQLVAAPVPSPPRYGGRPVYCTDFVVRADSKFARLSDVFGARIGWTLSHSQSGYNAVRHHLLQYRHRNPERLFAASIGPLITPRRVIEALLDGTIDVGPLDSYLHDLLSCHEPQTASQLRTIESTVMTPIPPLVASRSTAPDIVERLRRAFVGAAGDPVAADILDRLLLAGFVQVTGTDYDRFPIQALEAVAAHYEVPE